MPARTVSTGPPWLVANLRWGFPHNPEPRMALVVVAGLLFQGIQVHLEDDIGNRAFRVHGPLPQRVRKPLLTWVSEHRDDVENAWIRVMISKGWLTIRPTGKTVEVVAYEGHETVIKRTLDFTESPVWLDDDDVAVEDDVTLVLGVRGPQRARVRLKVGSIIWRGKSDGSDAHTIPF